MSKEDWKKNNIATMYNLKEVDSVLDVACGLAFKSKYVPAKMRVGIDIYDEYFKHIEAEVPYVLVKGDVRNLDQIFPEKSFDIVLALDIIEHVEKDEALKLIAACEKIARYAVILETPKGFSPQNLDILGYGGHEFQTHRCGFEVEELEGLGYEVRTRPYTMTPVKRHTDLEVELNIELINAIKYV